jgi:hypothetical protein
MEVGGQLTSHLPAVEEVIVTTPLLSTSLKAQPSTANVESAIAWVVHSQTHFAIASHNGQAKTCK